ncbi:MAG TPA: cysteine--tRNA ligase [Candidatus Binatia bacterium]|jgi:L-cysteine:1D-myo-inositol 2-amino-2-deoxy-alpha-D-glucopyranoside ligase|nr:cysteine--tRNA ligase [Candidatus Binatia bacterium]
MQLYNALTKKKEQSVATGNANALEDPITLYVCGITPYDTTHLGHCFTYASFDMLIRYLELQGYRVRYVQNVTDIDDDILGKAKEVQGNWREVGNRWTAHFIRDMREMNVKPPDEFPRATDVIDEIIKTTAALIRRGYAYEAAGNVYFHVDSWPEFGKLSNLPRDQMLDVANERGNHPDDPHKKDPLDFVLWQAQAPGEPAWDSPWGPGRPGWHIECSTMAGEYLDSPVDIHGGGADLIFPHHECEIAQYEGATGKQPFVRIWMHTAMVRHEGEKMSKSLGNLVMVRDLLDKGISPDALRLCLHAHHYATAWEFDEDSLQEAAERARLLRRAATIQGGSGAALNPRGMENTFHTAMGNDLDSPTALAALQQYASEIISGANAGHNVRKAQESLRTLCGVFGLRLDQAGEQPDPAIAEGWDRYLEEFS